MNFPTGDTFTFQAEDSETKVRMQSKRLQLISELDELMGFNQMYSTLHYTDNHQHSLLSVIKAFSLL